MATKLQIILDAEAKRLMSVLNSSSNAIKKFSKNVESGSKPASKLSGALSSIPLPAIAAGAAVATAAFKVMDFGRQSLDVAGKTDRLQRAVNNLASSYGQSGSEITKAIQAASGATISRMEAMSIAAKGLQFGIATTSNDFQELTQIAVTLGRSMGQSAGKSMEDLTVALSRQSPMILDNLGITLKLEEAYQRYAEENNKSVRALTAEEKQLAFTNEAKRKGLEVMEKLGGVQEDGVAKQERLNAVWEDFQGAVGSASAVTNTQAFALDFASEAVLVFTDVVNSLTGSEEVGTEAIKENTEALEGNAEAQGKTAEEIEAHFKALDKLALGAAKLYASMAEFQEDALEREQEYRDTQVDINQSADEKIKESNAKLAEELYNIKIESQDAQSAQEEWALNRRKELAIEKNEEQNAAIREKQQERLNDLREAHEEENKIAEEKLEELKQKTALKMLEASGELGQITGLVGVSAEDMFHLIDQGVVPATDQLIGAMAGAFDTVTKHSGDAATQSEENQARMSAAVSGSQDQMDKFGIVVSKNLPDASRLMTEALVGDLKKVGQASVATALQMDRVLENGLKIRSGANVRQNVRKLTDAELARFTQGRASGGPVTGGMPFMVGEQGPEMFVPGQNGMIIPNHQTNITNNNTLNFSSPSTIDPVQSFRMIEALTRN